MKSENEIESFFSISTLVQGQRTQNRMQSHRLFHALASSAQVRILRCVFMTSIPNWISEMEKKRRVLFDWAKLSNNSIDFNTIWLHRSHVMRNKDINFILFYFICQELLAESTRQANCEILLVVVLSVRSCHVNFNRRLSFWILNRFPFNFCIRKEKNKHFDRHICGRCRLCWNCTWKQKKNPAFQIFCNFFFIRWLRRPTVFCIFAR